jgi:hypothetical protein
MTPEVKQLNDHNFLVLINEEELPFRVGDMLNCGFGPPETLGEYQWWIEWKERQMIAAAKTAILSQTQVGQVLRSLPRYSHMKYGLYIKSAEHDYQFGFRVRIREKKHALYFKLSLCSLMGSTAP